MGYKLDDNQIKIAKHTKGAALVLAGPGSGKTTVLTERTVMLSQNIIDPQRILCVTFTNAAGKEMEKRFLKAYKEKKEEIEKIPVFKTVHSFCNDIIKKYEQLTNIQYKRIDNTLLGKKYIMSKIYTQFNGKYPDSNTVEKLCSVNNNSNEDSIPEIKYAKEILCAYQEYKKTNMMIDFDDMILFAREILTSKEKHKIEVKEYFCNYFEYIQVDEAQDLTNEQFEIMEIIASKGNIFVVADDDQSIYGFRGAAPECLFKFQQSHHDCKIYYLSRNYRSSKTIVDYSCKFISQNEKRFEKDLFSNRGESENPIIRCLKNHIKQSEYIKNEIKKLVETDSNIKIGILYRNNISGLIPGLVLTVCGEKYKCDGGDKFKTSEIDFLDIVLSQMRKIERNSMFLPTPSKMLCKLKEEGLYNKLDNYCRKSGRNVFYKNIIIEFLEYLCKNSNSVNEIIYFLDNIDNNKCLQSSDANIEFSTIHSSKGLEYDAVFIIDVIKGTFPGEKAMQGMALEEERRLFYVAMTRAKKYLYVLYPQKKDEESLFVKELKNIQIFLTN